jgi:hypothetical protein
MPRLSGRWGARGGSGEALIGFRKRVRACVRSRACFLVFRRHLRACVCSRAGDFAGRKILRCRRGREWCGGGAECLHSLLLSSSPDVIRGSTARWILRSPGHGLATGPVMTGEVVSPSERPRGGLARACAAASRKRGSRELKETSRKHGPLNLAPLFVFIGAQSERPVRW